MGINIIQRLKYKESVLKYSFYNKKYKKACIFIYIVLHYQLVSLFCRWRCY